MSHHRALLSQQLWSLAVALLADQLLTQLQCISSKLSCWQQSTAAALTGSKLTC
jgi:hypothetical protein